MFTLGYNTNGLAHHRLEDALPMLAELGYGAVALTLDVGQLDPFRATAGELGAIRALAEELGLSLVVETGARYLMDARRKHFPTLLEDSASDRQRRVDFLKRCTDIATSLGAGVVSVWAGRAPDGNSAGQAGPSVEKHWDHLCEGLLELLDHAGSCGVSVAFEPEPGMFIERPGQYRTLLDRLGARGESLWLTLDVGHLVVTGDLPVEDAIGAFSDRIRNVHLDDCPRGVHVHGPFGSGDLDLDATVRALIDSGYDGVASVELSRDSHRGALAAEQAMRELRRAIQVCS